MTRSGASRPANLRAGWPWCRETVALGAEFGNLELDLGRIAMSAPAAAAALLGEWLDMVPHGGRRLTFSGTAADPLETYAVRLAAEELLVDCLSARVSTGVLPMDAASEIIQSTLHDGAYRFFELGGPARLPTLR